MMKKKEIYDFCIKFYDYIFRISVSLQIKCVLRQNEV